MMRSLYVRVALTFLVAMFIALFLSGLLSLILFENELERADHRDMMANAERVIDIYKQTPAPDIDRYLSSMSILTEYAIQLYSEPAGMKRFEAYADSKSGEVAISPETVRRVLDGHIHYSRSNESESYVGIPFQAGDKTLALFLTPSARNEALMIRLGITFLILFSFICGLFIILGAIYIVRPMNKLTQATKRIAKGDFDIILNHKRKDELGTLARSFSEMAAGLQRLDQMRNQFVTNVSHEIQTPLTSISGFAMALKDNTLVPDHERASYLDIIIAESRRLSRLGEHLLKLASLDSHQPILKCSPFRLDEQLRQAAVSCEPLWSEKGIRLNLDLPARPAEISADPDQLNQVWLNLLGNSIKFTPSGGSISIRLRHIQSRNGYTITFSDSGIGMAQDQLVRIFEPFYKADASRKSEGNGLGLAIVKKIVALHQGSIEIESHVASGTTATVFLPGYTQVSSSA
ncbi:ATP-binding protein [Paenibacillus sp. GCM10027627]|uniref:sensor histidine kinase n=1 Tax=unclassified Paenibacillus TaxID=185978 RepID=UPI003630A985